MILVDYTAICFASIFSAQKNGVVDESTIRHMILNSLRLYNVKFRKQYGNMTLCCDESSWRKERFKHYKANRKKSRDEDPEFWKNAYAHLTTVAEEIDEFLPFDMLRVERAEADDIIAALSTREQLFGEHEEILIISSDKDMLQLTDAALSGNNVRQWCPRKRKYLNEMDVPFYRFEHFIRGDVSDGIPNIMSDEDTFVDESKRQTPVRSVNIKQWFAQHLDGATPRDIWACDKIVARFDQNKELIDLINGIPTDIVENVYTKYDKMKRVDGKRVMSYLIKKRCRMLIECAGDFMPTKK